MYSRFLEESHSNRDKDHHFEEVPTPTPTPTTENMNPSPSPSSSSPAYSSSFVPTALTPSTSTSTKLQTTTTRLEIKLPPGLPQLLEILARECIRNQPENILEYLASLSEELLEKRDGETLRDKAGVDKEAPTEKVDAEAQAAVKIQASYRGYKTRKDLHKKAEVTANAAVDLVVEEGRGTSIVSDKNKIVEIEDEEILAAIPPPLRTIGEIQRQPSIEDEAATKIQSGVRGFLTRKRMKAQRSLNNNNSIDEHMNAQSVSARSPPTQKSEPDEHDLAVERILKEYGSRPLPSFRDDGHKIESRTTSLEMHVQELEAELASSLSLSSGKENQETSVDKSDADAPIPLEEPEPETALASEPPETVEITNEEAEPEFVQAPKQPSDETVKSTDETDTTAPKSVKIQEPEPDEPMQHETESEASASDSDASQHGDGESDGEQSYTVNPVEGTAAMSDKAVTEDCVQLINAVLIEAESIVKSMDKPVEVELEASASASNENSQNSQSEPTSPREVIQVEISNSSATPTQVEDDDGSKKDRRSPKHEPVTIPAVVAKEDSVESQSVPLRNRSNRDRIPSEEKAPEAAPVVVRRSKRNTSDTETKYRSGFVEVTPADHEAMQKSFDKINMPHIDESEDLDREIEEEVMNNAAAKIQAGFRGYKARRTLNQAKASATCIQANFRGYKARRKIEQEKKAVVKIQATVRGFLARRRVAKEKLATQSKRRKSSTGFKLQRRRSSTLNAAAIRIQSAYRGYSVRKNYKELRQNSASPVDLRIEDVGAAEGDMI